MKNINRKELRKIKAYNNSELREFLINLYSIAYKEGLEKGIKINSKTDYTSDLIEAIDKTKGIGDKLETRLLMNLKKVMEG